MADNLPDKEALVAMYLKGIRRYKEEGLAYSGDFQRPSDSADFDTRWRSLKANIDLLDEQISRINLPKRMTRTRWAVVAAAAQELLPPSRASSEPSRIIRPPNARLSACAKWLLPAKAFQEVYEQGIADTQVEWADAHVAGDLKLAKWIRFRGVLQFWGTAFFHAWDSVAGRLFRGLIGIK